MSDTAADHRRCPRCEQVKPLAEFPRHRSRADGHAAHCFPCHRENVAAYRATPEGKAANLRAWYRSTAKAIAAREARESGVPQETPIREKRAAT